MEENKMQQRRYGRATSKFKHIKKESDRMLQARMGGREGGLEWKDRNRKNQREGQVA